MRLDTDQGVAQQQEERSSSSTYLVKLLAADRDEGWQELVGRFSEVIYRQCRSRGLRVEDAENVTGDVLLAVWKSIKSFRCRAGAKSFRKWLAVITSNKIKDFWKANPDWRIREGVGGSSWHRWLQAIEEELSQSSRLSASSGIDDDSRLELLCRVRAECSGRDWEIFERLILDDRSPAEVADEFSVSANVVYLVRSRLLQKLRSQLEVEAE